MEQQQQLQFQDEPENGDERNAEDDGSQHGINLFVKAGRDGIGCCPFSQRLFMVLWLKGVVFKVTTIDQAHKLPPEISEFVSKTKKPPYLWMNSELIDDVAKAEEYVEVELYPPKYPKLVPKHNQSKMVGADLFRNFSAWIKYSGNTQAKPYENVYKKFYNQLKQINEYLETPLDDEIDPNYDGVQKSTRKFIDGDTMTLADCNLLPKLNIIEITGKHKFDFDIPAEFEGIRRYLKAARECDEFDKTCPDPAEVLFTYFPDYLGPRKR